MKLLLLMLRVRALNRWGPLDSLRDVTQMVATFLWRLDPFGWHFVWHNPFVGVDGVWSAEHLQRVAQDIHLVSAWRINYFLLILNGDLTLDRFGLMLIVLSHASRYSSIRNPVFLSNKVTGFYTTDTPLLQVLLHRVVILLMLLRLAAIDRLHVGGYDGVGERLAVLEFLWERDTTN